MPATRSTSSLQAARERDSFGCDQRVAHLEFDLTMCEERDLARAAGEDASVEECGHRSTRGSDPMTAQWLVPDVEELAERVGALDRRFDVDDSVGGVRVQPHEAGRSGDKSTGRCQLDFVGRRDADSGGYLLRITPDDDPQMRV